jgi:phage gp36-like protein
MAYATREDIELAYGEELLHILADRDDGGSVDTESVDRALVDASAFIDGYLGSRYTVPITPTPAILKRYAVDVAVHYLADRAGVNTDERRQRYTDAVRFLERVAEGKLSLGASTPPPTSGNNTAQIASADRVFTRDNMKDF